MGIGAADGAVAVAALSLVGDLLRDAGGVAALAPGSDRSGTVSITRLLIEAWYVGRLPGDW
jgi:pyridoxal biosynthesis lyase PdxS